MIKKKYKKKFLEKLEVELMKKEIESNKLEKEREGKHQELVLNMKAKYKELKAELKESQAREAELRIENKKLTELLANQESLNKKNEKDKKMAEFESKLLSLQKEFKRLDMENQDLKENKKHLEITIEKQVVYKNFFEFFKKYQDQLREPITYDLAKDICKTFSTLNLKPLELVLKLQILTPVSAAEETTLQNLVKPSKIDIQKFILSSSASSQS